MPFILCKERLVNGGGVRRVSRNGHSSACMRDGLASRHGGEVKRRGRGPKGIL